jgi:hypothetical protein
MSQHRASNVTRSAHKAEYSILGDARTAPSYLLLNGSTFHPGAGMSCDAISRVYLSRYRNSAVVNCSVK